MNQAKNTTNDNYRRKNCLHEIQNPQKGAFILQRVVQALPLVSHFLQVCGPHTHLPQKESIKHMTRVRHIKPSSVWMLSQCMKPAVPSPLYLCLFKQFPY